MIKKELLRLIFDFYNELDEINKKNQSDRAKLLAERESFKKNFAKAKQNLQNFREAMKRGRINGRERKRGNA